MSKRIYAISGLAALLLQVAELMAQTPSKPVRLGLCVACHGEQGRAVVKGVPHLAGQDLDYLRNALAAYRSGARDISVMRSVVGALSEADLDELAHWYAMQPAGAERSKP